MSPRRCAQTTLMELWSSAGKKGSPFSTNALTAAFTAVWSRPSVSEAYRTSTRQNTAARTYPAGCVQHLARLHTTHRRFYVSQVRLNFRDVFQCRARNVNHQSGKLDKVFDTVSRGGLHGDKSIGCDTACALMRETAGVFSRQSCGRIYVCQVSPARLMFDHQTLTLSRPKAVW